VVLTFLAVVISTPSKPLRLPLRSLTSLAILEVGIAVKYNVYLREDAIELKFQPTNRSRVELAAFLLRRAGVGAEVKKKVESKDVWRIRVSIGKFAAGREELRNAIAEIVEAAHSKGWVDEKKAEGWLKELEKGLTLKEGWPKYNIQLTKGALVVGYHSTDPDSIQREAQRLRKMSLKEGRHFTVKMPEGTATVMCISLGRAWPMPPGFLSTALGGNGSWRRSS
jgi:hypothetical protein